MPEWRMRDGIPDLDTRLRDALRADPAPERLRLRILAALDQVDRQPADAPAPESGCRGLMN